MSEIELKKSPNKISNKALNRVLNKALNKAILRYKITPQQFASFKFELGKFFAEIENPNKDEEGYKTDLNNFLSAVFYPNKSHYTNTINKKDLAIYLGPNSTDKVGVIIETKQPTNKLEMITGDDLNSKALQQLVYYFLDEREIRSNFNQTKLIVTNFYQWYIFDASDFEKFFGQNKQLLKDFKEFKNGQQTSTKTSHFYQQIASKYIEEIKEQIDYTYFDLKDYKNIIDSNKSEDQSKLISLYKILDKHFLLKIPLENDANTLNKDFYNELLYLMGLEEITQNGKKIITRRTTPYEGSLLENTLSKISEKSSGNDPELFEKALACVILWINRILFLKLLEGQLVCFNQDKSYKFLTTEKIGDYDDLHSLFFQVLAKTEDQRESRFREKFNHVPYLNSSLFEYSDLEKEFVAINSLTDKIDLPIFEKTVLKQDGGKATGSLNPLKYLLNFLDAYDFGSQKDDVIDEDHKPLINSSVLGLIFEKINGYKDGSFFTPSFITMYMAREVVTKAVLEKFNSSKNWNSTSLEEIYNQIDDKYEANQLINSLKIVDPAVGSGHFLVSVLNEIIRIKQELKVLQDDTGKTLRDYHIQIENDELVIYDENGNLFEYKPNHPESQRVQETLFKEKQKIIENCLFGVDINPNSVAICRLRLWIELLKNAYYRENYTLQTLPNIDINIKCGNSLISRFDLKASVKEILKKSNLSVEEYRQLVQNYQNADSKEQKWEYEKKLTEIKNQFQINLTKDHPFKQELRKLESDQLFELDNHTKKRIEDLKTKIQDLEINPIYQHAFEWRFEFPQVLDEQGNFIGFDVVIGNPPYIGISNFNSWEKVYFRDNFSQSFVATGDVYSLFYEQGWCLLKSQGRLAFITSNKWMRAGYGQILRNFFATKTNPELLLDLGPNIFDSATVDSNLLFYSKDKNQGQTRALKISKSYFFSKEKPDFNLINFDHDGGWFLGSKAEFGLKQKIESVGKPLKDWDVKIYRGVLTGLNEAFIIDENKKNELIAKDPKSAEIIKPILRGRDIKRYGYEFANLYLINVHNGYKSEIPLLRGGTVGDGVGSIPPININDYPAIKEHLDSFEPSLSNRQDKGNTPYNLRNCAYLEEFEREKIVWTDMATKPTFTWLKDTIYFNNTCYMIIGGKKWHLGVLNSKLVDYIFPLIASSLGDKANRYFKQFVELLPIPTLDTPEKQEIARKIESLVEEILRIKNGNVGAGFIRPSAGFIRQNEERSINASPTEYLENQIDELVFELYGLSAKEVGIFQYD